MSNRPIDDRVAELAAQLCEDTAGHNVPDAIDGLLMTLSFQFTRCNSQDRESLLRLLREAMPGVRTLAEQFIQLMHAETAGEPSGRVLQ
jgi:hypothetical protein